jgi:hypothetical protein
MKPSHLMKNSWSGTQKRKTFALQATICLAVFLTVDSAPGYCNELLGKHPDLELRMTALLRWANFWKRQHEFKNYSPGKTVTVTAFYSGTRAEIYLPEIDVQMSFSIGTKGELVAMGNGLLRGEGVDQVARRRLRLPPEVRVKSVSPERTVIEDYWPPETDVLKQYQVERFSFRLPELTVPDSVRLRTIPKELEALKVAVSRAMVTWLCPEGTPIPNAIIPYFDPSDPWVYVAVDGPEMQRGLFIFEWRDGKWTSSKEWWPQRRERSEVISLVQQHALFTVKAECAP